MPLRVSWIRRLVHHTPARSRRPLSSQPLRVELLEDRCVPTAYVVTTTNDLLGDTTTGALTLRDAITAIDTQAKFGNAAAGTANNTIDFDITTLGTVQTIDVGSALPALSHQVFIDGWSQGGTNYSGPPLVVLNGAGAGGSADGLKFVAGSGASRVWGLVIQQFGGNGIEVQGTSGNVFTGNYIGTNASGTAPAGNGNDGILLNGGAMNNTIGGTTTGAGNVIAANGNSSAFTGNGVEITGSGTNGNVVEGNFIGTNKTGTAALGNADDGVLIAGGAAANTIGGTAAGSANVICGGFNLSAPSGPVPGAVFSLGPATISGSIASFDVDVSYADTPPNEAVYLGVDIRASSPALAPININTSDPDYSAFDFSPSSTLGLDWAPIGNLFPGEFLFHTPAPPGTSPPSGLLPGATYFVGTVTYDLSKFNITPSSTLFVSIEGVDTTVGTENPANTSTFQFLNPTFAPAEQPLVAGQGNTGIEITGSGTNGNMIRGNMIGANAQGTATLGHLTQGVFIHGGAQQNTVGGTIAHAGNVISGNDDGIILSDSGTSGNLIQGNLIGTDVHGSADLGNVLTGVLLESGAASNTVGGTVAGSSNTIAFSAKGVVVGSSPADTGTIHDTIEGNSIFGNSQLGISLGNGGATPNGANPRAFPNDGQNTPVITSLTTSSVSGSLTSTPNTMFRIELFALPIGDNQAPKPLGFIDVTSTTGVMTFTDKITLPLNTEVTATATNLANGDTSEFSPVGTQLLILTGPTVTSSNGTRTVTLSAQLLSGNMPVTTGQVSFAITGVPGVVNATTNSNGTVTVSFAVPTATTPGTYTLVASYAGADGIPGAEEQAIFTIPALLPAAVGRRWSR